MIGKLLEEGNNILAEKHIGARVGAETGAVVRMTRDYFDSIAIETRVLDAVPASTDIVLFGREFKTPVMPAALSGLDGICENGMAEVAKGTFEAGAAMWAGIGDEDEFASITATGAGTIKIIKPYKDPDDVFKTIEYAEKLGAIAVGMDVNFGLGGKLKDSLIRTEWFAPVTKSDLRRYIEATKLPFVVKGVLSLKDAEKSLECGAAAIDVTNHGGSIIDYAVPALKVLPDIVKFVDGRVPVFLDGGILRGSDIFKSLALGATGVLVGRTVMAGLAAGGSQGVCDMISGLTEELRRIMSLTGAKDLNSIDRDVLWME